MNRTLLRFRIAALLGMFPAVAGAVTLSLAPADTVVSVGDTFALRVVVSVAPDVKGVQFLWGYDASRLSLVGAGAGDILTHSGGAHFLQLLPDPTPPADVAWVDAARLDGTSAGPGIVAFLTFQATAEGDALLVPQSADVRNSLNAPVLTGLAGGIVHITGPTPATPGTWGRLKRLYR